MTLYTMMEKLVDNEIFAAPFDEDTITLFKYNSKETKDYLPGMVAIGTVRYDYIDNYTSHPEIDLENDTLTDADKALLKEVFNL